MKQEKDRWENLYAELDQKYDKDISLKNDLILFHENNNKTAKQDLKDQFEKFEQAMNQM